MKVIFSIVAFACFAVMFGIALLTTKRGEPGQFARVEIDDED